MTTATGRAGDEMVTVRETASMLRAAERTVRRMIQLGTLPARRVAGLRKVLIRRADVEALLAGQAG